MYLFHISSIPIFKAFIPLVTVVSKWLKKKSMDGVYDCALLLSRVQLFAWTPWTVAHQAPLSMGILQARILESVAMPSSRGIFPTQGSNPGLLHYRQILCCLSQQGNSLHDYITISI